MAAPDVTPRDQHRKPSPSGSREEDAIYRLVAENATEMIRLHDLAGHCIYASPSVERMFGRIPSDVFEAAHPEDVEGGRRWWRRVLAGGKEQFEWRVRAEDGSWHWIETSSTLVRYQERPHVMTVCRDITPRKRAEEALSAREAEFRNLAESSPGLMGVFHLRKDGSLCAPYASQRIWDLYELRPEDVVDDAEPVLTRTHPDDEARLRASILESAQNMAPWWLEYRVLHPTRGELWLEGYSNPFPHPDGGVVWYGYVQEITERKRAEEAARANEERLRLTFDAAKIGTGELDLVTRRITLSSALERVLGFPPGMSHITFEEYLERVHPDDRERLSREVETVNAGRPEIAIDYRVLSPDGDVRFTTSRAKAFFDAAGRATRIVATLMDITERQRAEDEVRRQKEVLQKIFDNAPLAISFFDEGGRLLLVNLAWERLFGWTLKELSDPELDVYAKLLPDPRERKRALEFMARGTGEWSAFNVRTKDGAPIDVLISTVRLSDGTHIGLLQDVTERLRADAARLRSEDLLRRAEAMAHLASFTIDVRDGTLLTSDEVHRQFNWAPTPHRVEDLLSLVHPDDRARVQEALEGAARGVPFEMELRFVVGEEVKWVLGRVEPELDHRGRVLRLIGVSQDVTARRRLEEQFRQAQKMEAIGTLAGGVAHDFNNLLTVISGYSDLLLNDLAPRNPMRELVLEIHRAGARARALIRQLLAFSRQQLLEPKVLDLNSVVTETEKMLRRLIGEDIELVVVLDPRLAQVKADPGQLEQVLVNLSVNARDAMPRGGPLSIETRNATLDPSLGPVPAGIPPGDYVMLAVSDTGVGMDPTTKARVFEPFFTTKEPGRGTGLGLAIVHGVVAQSGGHVEVESELGHGASFKIYLPAVTERLGVGRSFGNIGAAPPGRETILVVEDEAAVRKLVSSILSSCGYTILEAANGQDALRVAEGHAGSIELLVSDVVMPQLGGRQLAEQLTAVKPGLKVLLMSGYADAAVVRQGAVKMEHAFLQKPFTPAVLAQKVRDVLDQKH